MVKRRWPDITLFACLSLPHSCLLFSVFSFLLEKEKRETMDSNSGQTISIWMATAEVPGKPSLTENTHSDVCIVGAGIAGMTTAYLPLRARAGR